MSEKKHKSGYDILKERVADMENDAAFYRSQYREVSQERDMWKATADTHLANYDKERYMRYGLEEKLAFLLDHCPFWVRWLYRKHFEKGGN